MGIPAAYHTTSSWIILCMHPANESHWLGAYKNDPCFLTMVLPDKNEWALAHLRKEAEPCFNIKTRKNDSYYKDKMVIFITEIPMSLYRWGGLQPQSETIFKGWMACCFDKHYFCMVKHIFKKYTPNLPFSVLFQYEDNLSIYIIIHIVLK